MPYTSDAALVVPARGAFRSRLFAAAMSLAIVALAIAPAVATEISTDLWVYQYGDTVTVTGIDFGANEAVEIVTTDPYAVEVDRGQAQTDEFGSFTYSFVLLSDVPGIYDVVASGLSSGLTAATQFDPAVYALTANAPASVQYSDVVAFSGTVTCTKTTGGATNCPTTAADMAGPIVDAMVNFDPAGPSGLGYYTVASTTIAAADCTIHSTTTTNGLKATCNWSISWQAGRTAGGTHSVPPGTFPMRFVANTGASGPTLPGGSTKDDSRSITTTIEGSSTDYLGDTSANESTSLNLSADVSDFDLGAGAGNGQFAPDANLASSLASTNGIGYQLWTDSGCGGTSVAGPVYDDVDSSGGASGATMPIGAVGDVTYYMRTTYLGNAHYSSSFACDAVDIDAPNTPPDLTVPPSPVVVEATGPSGAAVSFSVSATDAEDNPDPTPTCDAASGSTFPLGNTLVTCSVTDSGSLSDSDSFTVSVVDSSDPVVNIYADVADAVAGGWYNSTSSGTDGVLVHVDVSDAVGAASLDCTDDTGSGPVAIPGPLSATGDSFVLNDGSHFIECTATDGASNTGSDDEGFDIDQTAPVIVDEGPTSSPNGNGWYNVDVDSEFSVTDALSGIDAACDAAFDESGNWQTQTTTGEGYDLTVFSDGCTDLAGNTADPLESAEFDVDGTAPAVTASPSRGTDYSDWFNFGLSISFEGVDDLSGVDDCDPSVFYDGPDTASALVSGSCTDLAGNTGSGSYSFKYDDTAPSVSVDPDRGPDHNGWYNATVTFDTTGSDAVSGVDDGDCTADQTYTGPDGPGLTVNGSCTNGAGLETTESSASFDFDDTDPYGVAFIGGGIVDGGEYYFGFVPAGPTGCTASDDTSGFDYCNVGGYSTAIGTHQLSATAFDEAGNEEQLLIAYEVKAWSLTGFYRPVDMGSFLNTVKGGSTVPLKFEIFAGPTELTDVSYVDHFDVVPFNCTSLVEDPIETLSTTGGTSLRYDGTGGQFIQNWQTPKKPGQCYRVTMWTDDGSSLSALFKLK